MPLNLRIENMDTLPDGGSLEMTVERKGLDIGRDAYLDWSLPDPQRFISGKHCEIHFRDGAYWLHDVSRNGTFMNGSTGRLKEPHRLQSGDKIHIGHYIVAVTAEGPEIQAGGGADSGPPAGYQDGFWDSIPGETPPAKNPSGFTPPPPSGGGAPSGTPVQGDPLSSMDWESNVISPVVGGSERKKDVLPPLDGGGSPTPPPPSPPSNDIFAVGADDDPWALPSSTPGAGSARPAPPPPPPPPEDDDDELVLQSSPPKPAADPPPLPPSPPPQAPPASGASGDPFVDSTAPAAPPSPPASGGLAGKWGTEPSKPAAEPLRAATPRPSAGGGGGNIQAAFARGAGIPQEIIAEADAEAFAEELGRVFRQTAESLKAMLVARDETKGAMRSANRTMIGLAENNPLKHSPTVEEALKIMLGPETSSFLGLRQTVEQSFQNLKDHQFRTFNAMQAALQEVFEDLSPEGVAGTTPEDGGLAALVSSRRAKLWDIYVERFRSKAGRHEKGMLGAFMLLFAEFYDDPRPR